MSYEAVLLVAVAFAATSVFQLFAAGGSADGWRRVALQSYLLAVFAIYFVWCWLRGGQTVAMKAWKIRLVAAGPGPIEPTRALLRFAIASFFIGAFLASIAAAFWHQSTLIAFATLALSGIGPGWALVDRERQFLHDRVAGTKLVDAR